MNADWHAAHVMPKNATLAQRVAWHRAHQRACACRAVPASLRELVAAAAPAAAGRSARATARSKPAKAKTKPRAK